MWYTIKIKITHYHTALVWHHYLPLRLTINEQTTKQELDGNWYSYTSNREEPLTTIKWSIHHKHIEGGSPAGSISSGLTVWHPPGVCKIYEDQIKYYCVVKKWWRHLPSSTTYYHGHCVSEAIPPAVTDWFVERSERVLSLLNLKVSLGGRLRLGIKPSGSAGTGWYGGPYTHSLIYIMLHKTRLVVCRWTPCLIDKSSLPFCGHHLRQGDVEERGYWSEDRDD